MITLQEMENYLETFLQTALFSDYCENGIQVEGKKEIRKLGTAVSASLETIQEAVNQNVDALLVHHGMFWKHHQYEKRNKKKKVATFDRKQHFSSWLSLTFGCASGSGK